MNEAYTGTLVWGRTSKSGPTAPPVRVEGAWEALFDRETYDQVQTTLRSRGFQKMHPRRVSSQFLLSGLAKCGSCGKSLVGQDAKSGKFSYYVCGTLLRQGAGRCNAQYLPKDKFEGLVVEKLKGHILTEEHLSQLVELVAEEMDASSTQWRERLDTIESELDDVKRRLGKLYDALETGALTMHDLAPRIQWLRHRQDQLEAARAEVQEQTNSRKRELMDAGTIVNSWKI